MIKKPRQDDIDPHKPYALKAAIQPRKETLAQKKLRIETENRTRRTELKAGDECWVVRSADQAVKLVVERIGAEEGWIYVREPTGALLVFSPITRRCSNMGRVLWQIYTVYEFERMQLWREDVLPKLEDLSHDYKRAGDMSIEELKALSAGLTVAIKARENRR